MSLTGAGLADKANGKIAATIRNGASYGWRLAKRDVKMADF